MPQTGLAQQSFISYRKKTAILNCTDKFTRSLVLRNDALIQDLQFIVTAALF